jgi:hypothetical protein
LIEVARLDPADVKGKTRWLNASNGHYQVMPFCLSQGTSEYRLFSAIFAGQKAGFRTESTMRSFVAFCPECKKTQSASFVQTANERKISEATFWLILSTRQNIEAIHAPTENDKLDHIWTLDETAREEALNYTRPSMPDCIDDRESVTWPWGISSMKVKQLTRKQLSSVPCPTCHVAAGERCVTGVGGLRFTPHTDRKVLAAKAVEEKTTHNAA